MKLITVANQKDWNKFVAENSSPASFLQTYEWGEFQKSLSLKIHRLAVTDEAGEYLACAQAIVRPLYLGKTYLEVTKGPIWKLEIGSWKLVIDELIKIAQKEKAVLLRINPPYDRLQSPISKLQAPEILLRQTEPKDTVLVDLTKSEDEMLSQMHEKSRYNIRLAIKKGVKVEDKTTDRAAFEKFLELIEETAKRDHITVWPRERFWKFREQFMANPLPNPPRKEEGINTNSSLLSGGGKVGGEIPHSILLTGEFEGKILAAAIVMLFGDSGTYLYAASSAENRNANVPSLVLWEAIRQSKLAGKKYYDMWGIAPAEASESHSWAGISRFKNRYIKIGETGKEIHYLGTRDLILDNKYYKLFKLAKKLRG